MIPKLLDLTLIYELTLFITTTVLSLKSTSTHNIGVMLLTLTLFADFYLPDFSSITTHKDGMVLFSVAGILLKLYVVGGMATFAVCFWFVGLDRFKQDSCVVFVFAFSKQPLCSAGKTVFKVLACINLAL